MTVTVPQDLAGADVAPVRQPRRLPPAIVVGYGYAGSELHAPALGRLARRLGLPHTVVAVDPLLAAESSGVETVPVFAELEQAAEAVRRDAVVHVCTPPEAHAATVAEAAALGFRRFVVEKPMVTTEEQLDDLLALERRDALDILVVSAWITSRLTERLLAEIDARRPLSLRALGIRQVKPRVMRSLTTNSHRSAFEVELPHQLSLARVLVGEPLTLVDALCSDLETVGARVEHMGVAELSLSADSAPVVVLHSDLTAPHRERSVLMSWEDGTRICGFYPCDRSDNYAQIMCYDGDGDLTERSFIADDAFDRFMLGAYAHFAGEGPRPVSDTTLHAEVCRILAEARRACGVDRGAERERAAT